MTQEKRESLRIRYEHELFERVLPFWLRHSPDPINGGHFNNLDHNGTIYDTTKHIWMQARLVWMFSKLYRVVEPREDWLNAAQSGMDFLKNHTIRPDGRVFFSVTSDGHPIYQQRKIFTECFYALALSEFGNAIDRASYIKEAILMVEKIWEWADDGTLIGRPALDGDQPSQPLAVPMMLLNLLDEVKTDIDCSSEIDECFQRIKLHVHGRHTFEYVSTQGKQLQGPNGRLVNPGHVIEAGWFIQHMAHRTNNNTMIEMGRKMIRDAQSNGWDKTFGGLYYFYDAEGFSPVQLEWSMKLWWPHCEALYAHLLNYAYTSNLDDFQSFHLTDDYIFRHFVDSKYGEWFGYCDQLGQITHRFKGGPYKGCYHVPRSLLLCWQLLQDWPNQKF
ncbi:MAG: AGE family epimerase/isomerase [Bacteroidetes bacterium]|nr:AGE family epimerase/isomerase [Bacteroidota bacterium]